jgi:hypothetical protein
MVGARVSLSRGGWAMIFKVQTVIILELLGPCLVPQFSPKFYYAKRRFSVTSKCRQMHRILNVDEIKN